MRDLIVIGAGPAGLAAASACARRGLDVLVVERRSLPVDKACGEGLMPPGVEGLERLGALALVPAADQAPLGAIRWIDEDGTAAVARLPSPGGRGIRRTALSAALAAAARAAGAEVRERCAARTHRSIPGGVAVETELGEERGRFLVAADGLDSAVRLRERLEVDHGLGRRFGLRRHFAIAPWSDAVEVYFTHGVEAYVTPAGERRVGVAFLCEESARGRFEELLARFPLLARRVAGAKFDSAVAGMGPLARAARSRLAGRVVLLGDAAGYVDALTGEGLSLALDAALGLGAALPDALRAGPAALEGFDRDASRRFARYAAVARLALTIARSPSARRQAIREGARHPELFARIVGWAVADPSRKGARPPLPA